MISTNRVLELLAERDEKFAIERANWTAERTLLIDRFHAERAELLNRIKPEAAQGVPMTGELIMPEAKDMFTDSDYDSPLAETMREVLEAGLTE